VGHGLEGPGDQLSEVAGLLVALPAHAHPPGFGRVGPLVGCFQPLENAVEAARQADERGHEVGRRVVGEEEGAHEAEEEIGDPGSLLRDRGQELAPLLPARDLFRDLGRHGMPPFVCPVEPGGLGFGARETVLRVLRANVDENREKLRTAIEETGFPKTDRAVGDLRRLSGLIEAEIGVRRRRARRRKPREGERTDPARGTWPRTRRAEPVGSPSRASARRAASVRSPSRALTR